MQYLVQLVCTPHPPFETARKLLTPFASSEYIRDRSDAGGNGSSEAKRTNVEGITEADLTGLERKYADGIPAPEIVSFFEERGVKFSEATLRKYVQLGLLPHSVRVGRKGKHKGSQGLYPVGTVRQILEIKRLLSENKTIEEIRQDYLLLRGDIEELEQKIRQLFEGIEGALGQRSDDETTAEYLRRELREARGAADGLVEKLRALEERLSVRARLARVAG
jgi:hypothetical protein